MLYFWINYSAAHIYVFQIMIYGASYLVLTGTIYKISMYLFCKKLNNSSVTINKHFYEFFSVILSHWFIDFSVSYVK